MTVKTDAWMAVLVELTQSFLRTHLSVAACVNLSFPVLRCLVTAPLHCDRSAARFSQVSVSISTAFMSRFTTSRYRNCGRRRGSRGGETGEFSPPFFWAPFFLIYFLCLKYWNNIRFLLISLIEVENGISDDWFYQSIYSFWAHKQTVQHVIQKRLVSML